MKKVFEYVYQHGASYWVRVRIPKDRTWAYPDGQGEVLDNLHTGAASEAKARSYAVIARIRADFAVYISNGRGPWQAPKSARASAWRAQSGAIADERGRMPGSGRGACAIAARAWQRLWNQ
jgi:hypothetical protein